MKYRWKKLIALSLISCMFGMSTMGCGSAPAAEAEAEMDAPTLTVEEINEPAMTDTSKPADDEAEKKETDTAETQDSGKWQIYDPDVAAAVDADFEGTVYKIETDSFFITPTETTLEENGAIISTSLSPGVEIPDEDLVQVTFDDDTVFILRNIYDGGERHEDSDASFQNIEKEVSVALKGKFQNDVFCADKIRIIKVH